LVIKPCADHRLRCGHQICLLRYIPRPPDRYPSVIVEDVPTLPVNQRDRLRRFIMLLDIFYEHAVRLYLSAEADPYGLFVNADGMPVVSYLLACFLIFCFNFAHVSHDPTGLANISDVIKLTFVCLCSHQLARDGFGRGTDAGSSGWSLLPSLRWHGELILVFVRFSGLEGIVGSSLLAFHTPLTVFSICGRSVYQAHRGLWFSGLSRSEPLAQ